MRTFSISSVFFKLALEVLWFNEIVTTETGQLVPFPNRTQFLRRLHSDPNMSTWLARHFNVVILEHSITIRDYAKLHV